MKEVRKIIRKILSEQFLLEKKNSYQKTKGSISRSHLPKEIKELALKMITSGSKFKNGIVTGLKMCPDLTKKIKEKDLPGGFSLGIDKNGFFIYTHRARSKSYETAAKIPIKDIRFIDSTG